MSKISNDITNFAVIRNLNFMFVILNFEFGYYLGFVIWALGFQCS